jgi:4-hydroxybenzoate polyprenyltransferase
VREASVLAVLASLIGILLTVPSGSATLLIGLTILGVGLVYDLRLKGTAWSWLPFAVGIPLLPVFSWLGSGSPLPGTFVLLVPAGFAAGAALAIGNGLADLERDAAAGVSSVAVRLGRKRAWLLHAALHGAVLAGAVVGGASLGIPAAVLVAGVVPATALGVGVALAGAASPARRERGWELQVIGVALLAGGWLAGTVVR